MVKEFPAASEGVGNEPSTLFALVLEMIALRHQIAVLKRSGTPRPCYRLWDRLFWIFLSRWWPGWRNGLVIGRLSLVAHYPGS